MKRNPHKKTRTKNQISDCDCTNILWFFLVDGFPNIFSLHLNFSIRNFDFLGEIIRAQLKVFPLCKNPSQRNISAEKYESLLVIFVPLELFSCKTLQVICFLLYLLLFGFKFVITYFSGDFPPSSGLFFWLFSKDLMLGSFFSFFPLRERDLNRSQTPGKKFQEIHHDNLSSAFLI